MDKPVVTSCYVCSAPVASDAKTCPSCGTPWPVDGKNVWQQINDELIEKYSLPNSEDLLTTLWNIVVRGVAILLIAIGGAILIALIT